MKTKQHISENSPWVWTLLIARGIQKPLTRARALCLAASAPSLKNQKVKIEELLRGANAAAQESAAFTLDKAAFFCQMSQAYLSANRASEARVVLENARESAKILPIEEQAHAQVAICKGLFEAGFSSDALADMNSLDALPLSDGFFSEVYGQALENAAYWFSRRKQEEQIVFLTSQVKALIKQRASLKTQPGSSFFVDRLMTGVVKGACVEGRFDVAHEAAKRLTEVVIKGEALLSIATGLAEAGKPTRALHAYLEAKETIDQMPEGLGKAWRWLEMAQGYLRLDDAGEALIALEKAAAEVAGIEDFLKKIELTAAVARGYLEAGEKTVARQRLVDALKVTGRLRGSYGRGCGHSLIGEALIEIGTPEEAKHQLLEGYHFLLEEKKASCRLLGFAGVAAGLLEIREENLAHEIVQQAMEVAREVSRETTRWRLLQEVADRFSQRKQFDTAFEVASEIRDADWQSWVFLDLLRALDLAEETLNEKQVNILNGARKYNVR